MNLKVSLYFVYFFFLLVLNPGNSSGQPTSFRIIGYVPSWADVTLFTQNFNFKNVTHLNYAFQNPDASGSLVESNNGLSALVLKAHASQVKVLISIGGGGSSATSGTIKTNFQNLISSPDKRAGFIHKIVTYLYQYKLDGLDVDEEGSAINSNYSAFIKQLADSLKPKGFLLTAAVGWGGENIANSAFQYFDWINLMAYDYTGNWDLTRPGQHSPVWFAKQMISDYKKRGVRKDQLCLGVPFYGYGFYKSAGSFSFKTILDRYPGAGNSDQVGDTIYYNGKATISEKVRLALGEASGIMIWELTQDANGENSLLNVINQTANSVNSIGSKDFGKEDGIILYPNPAGSHLLIDGLGSLKPVEVEIYDLNGRLLKVQSYRSVENKIRIRISSFPPGSYVCRIKDSERVFSKVFLKE